MPYVFRLSILALGYGVIASVATAQLPTEKSSDFPKAAPKDAQSNSDAVEAIVSRLMAYAKNKEGKLLREEVSDERLLRMFDRADVDKRGVVTREELVAMAKLVVADSVNAGLSPRGDSPRSPGGPGRRGSPGVSGRGGSGAIGGRPQMGQILRPSVVETLNLTESQKEELAELQKLVDDRLAKILTDKQKQQIKDLPDPGPSGRSPGGRGPGGSPPSGGGSPNGGPGGSPPK
jgi:hypothetical protein